ncbi:MAG TPA: phosphatase PAP2 family protein [Chryseosolibacter sp.]|nr:phosphatase PAP2 family protein [Chryseosolibacter sp.]
MTDQLIAWDKALFRFLNELHHPQLDQVMYQISQTYFWIPFYALLLYLLARKFKTSAWAPIICIALAIGISDRITSGVMKPYFERHRPSHDATVQEFVHTVNGYRGGQFGFASSHAANTFAVATFFWLLFRDSSKWALWLFPWAMLVSYSRIYLGVHFPADIIVGGLVGIVSAAGSFYLSNVLDKKLVARRNLS